MPSASNTRARLIADSKYRPKYLAQANTMTRAYSVATGHQATIGVNTTSDGYAVAATRSRDHGMPEIKVTDRFQRAMRLMRRHNPQDREDGFDLLKPHATEHLEQLIAAFTEERDDHGLRCWLLELIGEARSPEALPILVEQLYSNDESLRGWAVRGLVQLDTKPARAEL